MQGGYRFSYANSITSIDLASIHELLHSYKNYQLLMSMNSKHIAKITTDDSQSYSIDETSPFLLVVHNPNTQFKLYDHDGNLMN